MNRLYIMRHAEANWPAGTMSDYERPLSERGVTEAARMGTYLRNEITPPERILCSSAVRARQTMESVFVETSWDQDTVGIEQSLYLASRSTLLSFCEDEASCKDLLIIGHNPGLESLLKYLCDNNSGLNQTRFQLTTANVATIDLSEFQFNQQGSARLVSLKKPV